MKIKKIEKEQIVVTHIYMVNDEVYSCNPTVESGILLQAGSLEVTLNQKTYIITRDNVFTELPSFIHVAPQDKCIVKASADTEIVIIEMENSRTFESKVYNKEMLMSTKLGLSHLNGSDERTIVDIVNYDIEPNANIVAGEVISGQGSWSSYPPHSHEQPEIYAYKFDHQNGFGISIVGQDATIVKDGDITVIPGNLAHPQSCAPGYKMYYLWIIRNFEDNPWTDRVYQTEHKHILEGK